MKYPAPRLSQYGPWDYTQIDYDINAPLVMKGQQLCQGKPVNTVTATLAAGSTFNSQIVGSAPHGGGHCQWSLSYDSGKTWVVIDTYLETCPLKQDWAITIPSTAPAGQAVLAWSWVNAVGNREYYMNCADVIITQSNPTYAGAGGYVTGPQMLIVNVPGYPTIPEFLGNPKTGEDLFNARPIITVRLSGSTGGSSTPSSGGSTSGGSTSGSTSTSGGTTTKPSSGTSTPSSGSTTPSSGSTSTPSSGSTSTPPSTSSTSPSSPPPSTSTSNTNCRCEWAAYCGADSCGRTGASSSCQCSPGTQCMGGPSFQCRAPGAGSAPAPTHTSGCKCLWAGYCGPDTCGVQGAGSACACGGGATCGGAPYFQCRA